MGRSAVFACLAAALAGSTAMAQPALYAWTAKPDVAPSYGANHPVTRLAAVLARHRGQSDWSDTVISTKRWKAQWIQMAAGPPTRARFYGDDRTVWVVWSGQIRFTIAGQAPFVASKGFVVQAPARVAYSLETVGKTPSLRLEVTRGGGMLPVYPDGPEGQPADTDGRRYLKISSPTQPFPYDQVNRPYQDLAADMAPGAAPPTQPLQLVADADNAVGLVGPPAAGAAPEFNGRPFFLASDAFSLVLNGRSTPSIEGVGRLSAGPGDLVFAPAGRVMTSRDRDDARLVFSDRPNLFHTYIDDASGHKGQAQ